MTKTRRTKTVPGYVKRVCLGCLFPFTASRADAACCSERCRQRYKRKCDKVTASSAGTPKTHSMEVENCTHPDHTLVRKLTGKPVARSAGKPRKKTGKSTTRSTPRSKPTRKGGKKK